MVISNLDLNPTKQARYSLISTLGIWSRLFPWKSSYKEMVIEH